MVLLSSAERQAAIQFGSGSPVMAGNTLVDQWNEMAFDVQKCVVRLPDHHRLHSFIAPATVILSTLIVST